MKKFCYQLLMAALLILLIILFLKQYGAVFPSSKDSFFAAGILPTCLLAGTGILAGMILMLPDIMEMKSRKYRLHFQWSVCFGQGIPALLLFINQPLIGWLTVNDFMAAIFPELVGYPIAVSLVGSLWLGIILINTFKSNADMFHVKQRRRGR